MTGQSVEINLDEHVYRSAHKYKIILMSDSESIGLRSSPQKNGSPDFLVVSILRLMISPIIFLSSSPNSMASS